MNLFEPKLPTNIDQILLIQTWVRKQLALSEEVAVMVTELRCSEPGCPPLETMIAILEGPGQRRVLKIHKQMAEVTGDDIALAIRDA